MKSNIASEKGFIAVSADTVEWGRQLPQPKLTTVEMRLLEEALDTDYKNGGIRLREGEYQHALAKAIASFELELCFPDVKDITRRLYGEEKANDIHFVRKIQTILKKLEKSNVVKILPKKRPWDLQRYALLSFKFHDSDKVPVMFATDQEIEQAQNLLKHLLIQQRAPADRLRKVRIKIGALALMVVAAYMIILWDFLQPITNPIIFFAAFPIAVACSLALGKMLSET